MADSETVVVAPAPAPEPAPASPPAPVQAPPTAEEIAAATAVLSRAALARAPAPVAKPNLCMAIRAWNKTKCAAMTTFWSTLGFAACAAKAIKGLRTILFFTTVGASSLLASIEGVDLSGVASHLVGLKIEYSDLMLGISLAGIGLRLLTDTSAFKRWKAAARGDGESAGVGSGDVDEPAEAK